MYEINLFLYKHFAASVHPSYKNFKAQFFEGSEPLISVTSINLFEQVHTPTLISLPK